MHFELALSNFAQDSDCPVVFHSFIRENGRSETNFEMTSFLYFPPKPLHAHHFITSQ